MSTLHNEDPLIGQCLANYRLERVIGRGGMATVYYGTDIKLNRPVAVKVIDARYRNNPAYAERFIRESQIVATWRHQNILQIYYADDQDDLYYFAMEYVDGLDLRQLVDMYNQDNTLMPHEDVLRIGYAVADALDYAHTHGVIHRDVKPSNVMVAYTGQVLLTDFGLAMQVTEGSIGEVFGTPHYMAPEQARRSADAVPRSDIYSMGVILFELVTGMVPFNDESPTSVALMHLTESPPLPSEFNPKLPRGVDDVILQALQKEPQERYATCRQLVEALHESLMGEAADPNLLPPFPAMIERSRVVNGRDRELTMNYLTVAERLALHQQLRVDDLTTPYPDPDIDPVSSPSIPEERPEPSSGRLTRTQRSWLIGGVALIGMILVIGFGGRALWGNPAVEVEPTPPSVALAVDQPDDTPTPPNPTATLPQPPISTAEPTATPRLLVVDNPTVTATVEPSSTPPITPASIGPAPTQTPSVIIEPDLLLIYNNPMAFYIVNQTERAIDLSPLSFIAVNEEGQMVEYVFQVADWTNTRLESDKCSGLEVVEARRDLRPPPCSGFNWVDHPGLDSTRIFWQSRPAEGVFSFRVMWAGQPIQSCVTLSGTCAVALP
ncbi:MAG: protein kinase [Ardenticatenaceae bacterium]|nr:protein kinase [Ardenticatenaceae bacterium]